MTTAGLFDSVSSVVQGVRRYLPEPLARGVDFAERFARAKDELVIDLAPEYKELLDRQIEVQLQVQQVTFMSNLERANHESRMAPVRNMRVN